MFIIFLQIFLILFLIILNGYFALSEIALLSARKSHLRHLSKQGNKKAKVALELVRESPEILSTIQIGITVIGIFAGAFGGATVSEYLEVYISKISFLSNYSELLSVVIVVVVITYLSLVVGELVPKQIALSSPEKLALSVAKPMRMLKKIFSPFVKVLSYSTLFMLRLLRIKPIVEQVITEEEIKLLIAEGAESGIFEKSEQKMVEQIFHLGNRPIKDFMTLREEIIWLDVNDSFQSIQKKVKSSDRSLFPVCEGSLDNNLGVIETKDILFHFFDKEVLPMDLRLLVQPVGHIESNIPALVAIERLRHSAVNIALITDKSKKTVVGIVTFHDILEAIAGEFKGER